MSCRTGGKHNRGGLDRLDNARQEHSKEQGNVIHKSSFFCMFV